jgi:LacI family transcriptional regulator
MCYLPYTIHRSLLAGLETARLMRRRLGDGIKVVTIADVAKQAGVSQTTVSHTLSGKRPVAPQTRERIAQVIKDLNFRPSAVARSLRIQHTQTIALVIPDITNPFYPTIARGLQDILIQSGYYSFICNTESNLEQEITFLTEAISRHVDGIVLASHYDRTDELREFLNEKIPVVSLESSINLPNVDSVSSDNYQGVKHAMEYLLKKGHRRIGMVGSSWHHPTHEVRKAGYSDALLAAGIPYDETIVVQRDFTRAGGLEATRYLLDYFKGDRYKDRPTALFCANDMVAIGAMDMIHQCGLSIPDDIAIVGYDDIEAAALIRPTLTTVLNPAYEIGQAIGQLLLERMQGTYQGPSRHITIPYQFIQRESA